MKEVKRVENLESVVSFFMRNIEIYKRILVFIVFKYCFEYGDRLFEEGIDSFLDVVE